MMKSACFTGHRTLSGNIEILEKRLYIVLEKAIMNGVSDFYAGGAVGWDALASLTVLKLRKVYPHIKLHLILPCSPEEQGSGWSEVQQSKYAVVRDSADTVEQTAEHYYNGCMKVRNARLVELASECCICYWNVNDKRSGTGQTVRMAQKKGIEIINVYEH